jgi:hypothetical protein
MELKQELYDAVLVIGNGFDLNLGLETSYSSFIRSNYFKDLLEKDNQLCLYLNSIHNLENWIDIENELKTYSKKAGINNNHFFENFKELSSSLKEFLSNIDYKSLNKKSLAYKLMLNAKDLNMLIIDFNYTFSIENIFKELEVEINSEDSVIEHIKIHGGINDNIIFGVEDKADISKGHIFLKKSVNINFNAFDFSKAILNSETFVVFGHSLGETDHTYFEDYFTKTANKIPNHERQDVIIYYYGEKSYYDIFTQIDKLTRWQITSFRQHTNFKVENTKENEKNA